MWTFKLLNIICSWTQYYLKNLHRQLYDVANKFSIIEAALQLLIAWVKQSSLKLPVLITISSC